MSAVAPLPGQPAALRGGPASTSTRVVKAVGALLLLNALLSFENWWPTPAIKPDSRLAPEFVMLWVSARNLPLWLQLAILAAVALCFVGLHRGLRALIAVAAREAVPYALRSRWSLGVTAAALVLVAANLAGVRATWPVVSKPVLPTYLRQADLLATAFSPIRLAQALPPSPPFRSDLAALEGADVKLLFVESYGAVAFDNPQARRELTASRAALASAIEAGGRQVVSAYVRAATFGGASELSHLSLLSGVDLSDPIRHDLLLTTSRPTLVSLFRSHGYQTLGFYPALNWDWPEKAFYGFDRFYDRRDLDYRGPRLGYWWIPDQIALARLEQREPIRPNSPPRLLFFPTITSHIPFRPVPPYQPDWARAATDQPFDDDQIARAQADRVDWLDLFPAYLRMMEYSYRWIAGYVERPAPRDYLLILVGDHQPASGVSGSGAPWEVPVHVVSSNPRLLERFVARGFRPGLEPQRPALGGMHDLTRVLLGAFDGSSPPPESLANDH